MGRKLFPALMRRRSARRRISPALELDTVTTRIVRLLQPKARIINSDFTAPTSPPSTILPSATHPSPIVPSDQAASTGRWVSGCTTTSLSGRSTS
ncbi:hypothetical protein ACOJBO_07935 [Rhizobium beringeri]